MATIGASGAAARVETMRPAHLAAVVALADRVIGPGYWSLDGAAAALARSRRGDVVLSHVGLDAAGALVGFRFAVPPGAWRKGRGPGLRPDLWPFALDDAGYVQSAFVAPEARGHGLGAAMARAALADLCAIGAKGVVTHSWKESPGGSSRAYLERLGFVAVVEHPDYWRDVDYVCRRDGAPCRCTAVEMVRSLTSGAATMEFA